MKRELSIREAKHVNGNVYQCFRCTVEQDGYTASNEFHEELGKSAEDPDIKEKLELYFTHIEKIVTGILALNLVRELKIKPFREPNPYKNKDGTTTEGDLYICEVRSKDGKCYGSMAMLITELDNSETINGLTEEMYKAVELSIYRRPERFCQCKNKGEETDVEIAKETADEFRSQNIV